MEKITNTRELKNLLSKTRFTVNYYQREYRWGRKQIEQLIEDLAATFDSYYNDKKFDHSSTKEVQNYGYYYMGSIIRTSGIGNEIIDGQQRLTSLTLLLIYLNNLLNENNRKISAIEDMIYSDSFGERDFNINVPERKDCFNNLFENNINFKPKNESSETMKQRYMDIADIFPDELKQEPLQFFTYWLIEKVLFMEIVTPTEQDAHKIFVTMNDRGLSLNSAEMLKGYLLSEIKDNDFRNEANSIWKNKIAEIKNNSKAENDGVVNTEDVDFIATWIRAKYAESMRDTKKGADDKDFEIIGREFHQWVRNNAKKIGLKTSTNYKNFVCKEMPLFADLWISLKKYSENFNKEFEYVFYNANRDLNYQTMLIMSSVSIDDTKDIVDKKIKMVSIFVDLFASIRTFNYKKVNYNSNKDILFKLMNKIRNADIATLASTLIKTIKSMGFSLDGIDKFDLNLFTGRYMLHILSRFTTYIDEKIGNPSKFSEYVNRKMKNPYDVEHILPNDFNTYKDDFISEEEFEAYRAKLGNLIILTKDKNRSYQAKKYAEKVELYMGDNCLAKALNSKNYQNNPGFLKLSYPFKPYEKFDKTAINERQELYKSIAYDIWSESNIRQIADYWIEEKSEEEELIKVYFDDYGDKTNTKPHELHFNNEIYTTNKYSDMLYRIVEELANINKNKLMGLAKENFSPTASDTPYITTNKNSLRKAYQVNQSEIYIETNLSANYILEFIKVLFHEFEINFEENYFYIKK